MEEFVKCAANPYYFINTKINILHLERGVVPFLMYPYQAGALKHIISEQYSISLKPRQMGMTTLLAALMLWLAMFHPNTNCLVISIKMTVAKGFLKKVRGMYKRLPDYLKMEIVNGNKSMGTATEMIFANESEISVSAATSDAGRSESINFLGIDEVAFQRNAEEIWGAAQPTLSTGGQACMISTAYGMGNLFHKTWDDAVQGVNKFFPIKLNWRMHPDRDDEWYQDQLRALGKKRTAQEVDCDFLKSGYNVFDLIDIKVIEDKLSDTLVKETDLQGMVQVFFLPEPGVRYVIGADVATGRARDYSAFSIMDLSGKEHACFKGKLDVGAFTELLMKWGKRYNYAILAPEVNGIGESIIALLQKSRYNRVYAEIKKIKKPGMSKPEEVPRFGWSTTGANRDDIIANMDTDLINDTVDLYNPYFVKEAKTFVYNDYGKPIALGKELLKGSTIASMYQDDDEEGVVYNDDSIMAACITNEVRKRVKRFKGPLPLLGG